jgi:hypothetical protein
VRAHRIHHALHISIFYFSCLLHVGGGQSTLAVLVKNVMYVNNSCHVILKLLDSHSVHKRVHMKGTVRILRESCLLPQL